MRSGGKSISRDDCHDPLSRVQNYQVTHGDVVLVCRLDRLARSTRDLLNVLAHLSESGVGFRSLKETMIDTTSAHGRLMLGVLAAIGEFERE